MSLLSFRRRLLSCLDLICSEGQGLPRHHSVRLQDELWSCGILILVASTNLRARYSPILLATDASLDWEAGVKAQVGERFGEEL